MTLTAHPVPFAERDPDELLTAAETADILRTSINTVYWWRQKGTGPEFFKIGRQLMTTVSEVRRFIDEQRRRQTRGQQSAPPMGPARPRFHG